MDRGNDFQRYSFILILIKCTRATGLIWRSSTYRKSCTKRRHCEENNVNKTTHDVTYVRSSLSVSTRPFRFYVVRKMAA